MPGEINDVYVHARRVLLDALDALADHLNAVILVGAQAIYLHVGEGDIVVAVYTSDGDIALDPAALADDPKIDALMRSKGFTPDPEPSHIGTWIEPGGVVPVDLMVPDAVSGRAAEVPTLAHMETGSPDGQEDSKRRSWIVPN